MEELLIFPWNILHVWASHTVHGVLKVRVLKATILNWFAIPFSSGHFVRTLHHDPSVLSGPTWHDS